MLPSLGPKLQQGRRQPPSCHRTMRVSWGNPSGLEARQVKQLKLSTKLSRRCQRWRAHSCGSPAPTQPALQTGCLCRYITKEEYANEAMPKQHIHTHSE